MRDREKVRANNKRWREKHKAELKAYGKAYYIKHKDRIKECFRATRLEALQAYGGCVCRCCGETTFEFLAIDHIEGGGYKHRTSLKLGGSSFVAWLIARNYPPGFQVLCHNCNMAKGFHGGCPHARILAGNSERGDIVQSIVT